MIYIIFAIYVVISAGLIIRLTSSKKVAQNNLLPEVKNNKLMTEDYRNFFNFNYHEMSLGNFDAEQFKKLEEHIAILTTKCAAIDPKLSEFESKLAKLATVPVQTENIELSKFPDILKTVRDLKVILPNRDNFAIYKEARRIHGLSS